MRSDKRVTPPLPQSPALPSSRKPEGETLEGAAVGFHCGAGRTSWPSADGRSPGEGLLVGAETLLGS